MNSQRKFVRGGASYVAAGVLGLLVAGCSTHQVDMAYSPAAVVKPAAATPTVNVVSVSDNRKHKGAHLGAIRGGYGNAIKTIEASQPVKDVVRQAFTDGLAARGMLAQTGGAQYGLEITVDRLDCSQLVRREAHAKFQLALVDQASGQKVFSKTAEDDRTDSGSLVETGIFGSVEDLHRLVKASMQAAVDQALDDSMFQAATARSPALVGGAKPPAAISQVNAAPADRLRDLQSPLDQKLITKQEYDERRKAIVGAL